MSAHEMQETHEKIHEAGHGGHHGPGRNRVVAILISALAALLALVEIAANGSQMAAVAANIEAANLWAFFQAKTVRASTLMAAADTLEAIAPAALDHDRAAKQIAQWRATASRYESEPGTGEGRKELAARARAAEALRDRKAAAYHLFEYGAGAFQIAIVLASAAVVTGVMALAWTSCGLGVAGLLCALAGWLAPTVAHF